MTNVNKKYYVNVKELLELQTPKCNLPRPRLKHLILVASGEDEQGRN